MRPHFLIVLGALLSFAMGIFALPMPAGTQTRSQAAAEMKAAQTRMARVHHTVDE